MGAYSHGARSLDSRDRIREALAAKETRYGRELGEPYAICVFPTSFHLICHEEQALLGTVSYVMASPGQFSKRLNFDGYFLERRGPRRRHTQVSAVVMFDHRCPVGGRFESRFRVYHNPFATFPFPQAAFEGWPQWVLQADGATLGWNEPPGPPDPAAVE